MARRKGKRSVKATAQRLNSIGATDIRRQRGEVVTEEVKYEIAPEQFVVLRNIDRVQDFIQRYAKRGEITKRQESAGNRFAKDAEGAGIWPKNSMAGSGGGDIESAIWKMGAVARLPSMRLREAIRALGPLTSVVYAVVVEGQSAHEWATLNGKVPRDGMALLKHGLDALVVHYGIDR
jgi:hypothetical protein